MISRILGGLCLCMVLSSCAVGRVSLDGTLHGYAFGTGAKLEWCHPVGESGLLIKTVTEECTRIEGGNIVSGVFDLLGSVGMASWKLFSSWLTGGIL